MSLRDRPLLRRSLAALAALASPLLGLPRPARACPHCEGAQAQAPAPRFARSVRRYTLPKVTLTDQDGRQVPLAEALPGDAPVAVNFIFTTCSTICPVQSATLSGLRKQLGAQAGRVRLVSISIDPEHDRPEVLKAYAGRFGAPADWRFYTGSAAEIRAVLTAFEAFAGDKANHRPITLLRPARGEEWVRLEGFPSARELAEQLHDLESQKGPDAPGGGAAGGPGGGAGRAGGAAGPKPPR